MTPGQPFHAFSCYGIELEYMIVDRESLAVRPLAARMLSSLNGGQGSNGSRGPLGWSNELVSHVVELKNREPTSSLTPLPELFQHEIRAGNDVVAQFGAKLLPTGMHPWMDPRRDTELWTNSDAEIYRTFDRIFDCRTHGWANVQSMHINLPFSGDVEFARLHAAIRAVLPLLPALSASSPLVDARRSAFLDSRVEAYRTNAEAVPEVAGAIIPETVSNRADYEARVLAPMYEAIAPLDPDRVLKREWLNSRGAIARFERSSIEIRLADTQECPRADLAIAAACVAAVRALYSERWVSLQALQEIPLDALVATLNTCAREADQALVDVRLLRALGVRSNACRAGTLWAHLIDSSAADEACREPWAQQPLRLILEEGPLARRILDAIDGDPVPARVREVYDRLAGCLADGRLLSNR